MSVARAARIAIGKRRLKNVLRDRLYANQRQLESKISEAGPDDQRVDPHLLSVAIKDLQNSSEIVCHTGPNGTHFFSLPQFDVRFPDDAGRKTLIDDVYSRFHRTAIQQSLCGDALETVIHASFADAGGYQEFGSRGNPLLNFGPIRLPGAVDSIQLLADPLLLVVVEAKNYREWIYPDKEQLWGLINKSLLLVDSPMPVTPLFVTRKIPYYTRLVLKEVGVLGFEMRKQYFDPSVDVTDFRHKDKLGFHDIVADTSPSPTLTAYLAETLKVHGPTYAARFKHNAPVLRRYAAQLADPNVRFEHRKNLYVAVLTELSLEDPIP